MAAEVARYWQHAAVAGVDLLRARYVTHRYGRHAHETYTFGLIEAGVEEFDYGGHAAARRARRGRAARPGNGAHRPGRRRRRAGPTGCCIQRSAWSPRSPRSSAGGGHAALPADGGLRRAQRRAAAQRAPGRRARRPARLLQPARRRRWPACCAPTRGRAAPARDPVAAPRRARAAAVRTSATCCTSGWPTRPALAELAAMTGLSQFALLRAFRAETGLPPHAYLNQLRVRRARRCSTRAWRRPRSRRRLASPTRRT